MHSQNRQGGHKPQGAASLDLRDDLNTPSVAEQRAAHWKVRFVHGDISLRHREDKTVAYIASRMPAIYAPFPRVLRNIVRFQ